MQPHCPSFRSIVHNAKVKDSAPVSKGIFNSIFAALWFAAECRDRYRHLLDVHDFRNRFLLSTIERTPIAESCLSLQAQVLLVFVRLF